MRPEAASWMSGLPLADDAAEFRRLQPLKLGQSPLRLAEERRLRHYPSFRFGVGQKAKQPVWTKQLVAQRNRACYRSEDVADFVLDMFVVDHQETLLK